MSHIQNLPSGKHMLSAKRNLKRTCTYPRINLWFLIVDFWFLISDFWFLIYERVVREHWPHNVQDNLVRLHLRSPHWSIFRMIGLILGAPPPEFFSFLQCAAGLREILSALTTDIWKLTFLSFRNLTFGNTVTVSYVKTHTKMSGFINLKLHFCNKQLSTS